MVADLAGESPYVYYCARLNLLELNDHFYAHFDCVIKQNILRVHNHDQTSFFNGPALYRGYLLSERTVSSVFYSIPGVKEKWSVVENASQGCNGRMILAIK